MAGKPKRGLEYFSLDVDVLEHMKIRRLIDREGIIGFGTFVVLLMDIYKKGHILNYDNIDDVIFNIADRLKVTESEVGVAIESIIDLNLMDKDSFDSGGFTSKGVQERYVLSTKRRIVRLPDEQRLLTQREIFNLDSKIVYNDGMYVNGDLINEYKNKQSKSNSKSKRDKLKINNNMGSVDPSTYPFKFNYYLKILVDNNIIKGTEEFIKSLNDFLYNASREYEKEAMRKAIYYTVKRIKYFKWMDAENNSIVNKEAYLIESIKNNASRNETKQEKNIRSGEFQSILHKLWE